MARMSVAQRRAALIASAYRVIADHGVEGATTRRICAHADMPLASFHYAFESRSALLCAVMDRAVPEDITAMLESILPLVPVTGQGRDAMLQSMYGHFRGFYRLLQADPGRMQAAIALGLYAHSHPELQQVGKAMYERLYEVAAIGLDLAGQRMGVRWTVPVADLGPVVIAITNTVTLTYLSTADDVTVERIIEIFVNALATYVDDTPLEVIPPERATQPIAPAAPTD